MSKVEVNTIDTQCGSALQIGDGNTATIGLGKSGDTITVPCGATIVNSGTATGFGRTGTVDWVTTPKVTGDSPVTGVSGSGYFLNTAAGTITLNLPAGAAGSIVSLADYSGTWQTSNVTVAPNGSEKIGGTNTSVVLSTEGQSITLVYVDSTQGWLNTMDSTSNVRGASFIVATGGNQPTAGGCIVCTNYKIHKFTGPGTWCVSSAGNSAGSNTVDYMVVAGGGGGGGCCGFSGAGAGGGAGGWRASAGTASGCYTAGPAPLTVPASALPISVQGYPIAVGGGGPSPAPPSPGPGGQTGDDGANSSFSSVTSTGGGGGGGGKCVGFDGSPGGSGGGAGTNSCASATAGSGNTPSTSPPQGNDGGLDNQQGSPNPSYGAGGGGGTTVAGTTATTPLAGPGGAGATSCISATPTAYGGGGGGGSGPGSICSGAGGTGGGGAGNRGGTGTAGTINTGGGGGGAGHPSAQQGGAGGSGIVFIRYKFQ